MMVTTYIEDKYLKEENLEALLMELFPDGDWEITTLDSTAGKSSYMVEAPREVTEAEIESVTDNE
ncbi:hypothetical protein BDV96DRAFT_685656 [Lophiotrema nucula]|uniref:Uncharacterized protein n=1 Tax=Lophiotrema nucula TaxID=690887 RepID=A0A6A5ZI20_9PLEO|nr:hypothetical protein BDV96DRAFT_685656 [Lophiotrema nucula]